MRAVADAHPARSRVAVLAGTTSVLVTASVLGALLGFLEKVPCRAGAWNSAVGQFRDNCYTDIYPLYFAEKLASGKVPYLGHHLEYPVLIGAVMQAAAWVVRPIADPYTRGREFFDVTVIFLAVCAVAGVLATAYAAGRRRRWQALMVALAPGLILSAFINWDLLAMALTALGVAAWAARRCALAGALLGLAVATKFYPLLFFGPLLLLCLRAGRMRQFWVTTGSAAAAWLAVNLPVMVVAPSGWATFYVFSRSRPADWGSVWYFFEYVHVPVLGATSLPVLNLMSAACFAVACLLIAVLALTAPRRPRLPQLFFLVLAAFLMTNKVWSPQCVIWLVPLAVLARPRLWPYALWQLASAAYFFGIWGYFVFLYQGAGHGLSPGWYFATLIARLAAVALLAGYVVRDILRPGGDVVRDGGEDDPAGGVLAGAPDRFTLRFRRNAAPGAGHPALPFGGPLSPPPGDP